MSTTTTLHETRPSYVKKLEGVTLTEELLGLWKESYSKAQFDTSGASTNERDLSRKQALQILKDNVHPNQDPKFVPMDVLKALEVLDSAALERALSGATSLAFTPPPGPVEKIAASRKFQQRMERLRLKNEEKKYVKLTNNLQKEVQDDITAKSMTYAASVGLNMIVAPLSFGCFMYFFAGGIFDYFWGEEFSARTTGGTDIKRVIVGVVSGVIMLFIEMTLFVIRTHEVEAHAVKKKKKKKEVQPFGVYSKRGDHQAIPYDRATRSIFKKKD